MREKLPQGEGVDSEEVGGWRLVAEGQRRRDHELPR